MTQDLQQEFHELRNNAAQKLRTGFPRGLGDERLLRLISMPSFHPWTTWELYNVRGSESILVRGIWRADLDGEKLRDPVTRLRYPRILEPTLELSTRQISQEFAQSTLDDLSKMRLPAHPGSVLISLDGTSYELTTGSRLFGEATFCWHENSPTS